LCLGAIFPDVAAVADDLLLLHRHGLIDLRLPPFPDANTPPANRLNDREKCWGGYATTPYHTHELVD
jgi:hypothetical protein